MKLFLSTLFIFFTLFSSTAMLGMNQSMFGKRQQPKTILNLMQNNKCIAQRGIPNEYALQIKIIQDRKTYKTTDINTPLNIYNMSPKTFVHLPEMMRLSFQLKNNDTKESAHKALTTLLNNMEPTTFAELIEGMNYLCINNKIIINPDLHAISTQLLEKEKSQYTFHEIISGAVLQKILENHKNIKKSFDSVNSALMPWAKKFFVHYYRMKIKKCITQMPLDKNTDEVFCSPDQNLKILFSRMHHASTYTNITIKQTGQADLAISFSNDIKGIPSSFFNNAITNNDQSIFALISQHINSTLIVNKTTKECYRIPGHYTSGCFAKDGINIYLTVFDESGLPGTDVGDVIIYNTAKKEGQKLPGWNRQFMNHHGQRIYPAQDIQCNEDDTVIVGGNGKIFVIGTRNSLDENFEFHILDINKSLVDTDYIDYHYLTTNGKEIYLIQTGNFTTQKSLNTYIYNIETKKLTQIKPISLEESFYKHRIFFLLDNNFLVLEMKDYNSEKKSVKVWYFINTRTKKTCMITEEMIQKNEIDKIVNTMITSNTMDILTEIPAEDSWFNVKEALSRFLPF